MFAKKQTPISAKLAMLCGILEISQFLTNFLKSQNLGQFFRFGSKKMSYNPKFGPFPKSLLGVGF